ncbi:protein FAM32A-like [Pimephales promelas]|uniref:protein FAM32A-like n=1 Tax=Pimephales promelas TaxID=90988 RepID=UPI001955C1C9|nr:protein FAM32A-like [Pimephales promelas]KAG1945820.1 protein FAM32A-like [Pimephales promelas]
MSEYKSVSKGSLKLKGVSLASKKKKKKDKERKRLEEQAMTLEEQAMTLEEQAMTSQNENGTKKVYVDKRTPAQISFDKIQEKRQMERILKKASKTHKRRVEDFNRHLDSLTEHYDIPKVSWTK